MRQIEGVPPRRTDKGFIWIPFFELKGKRKIWFDAYFSSFLDKNIRRAVLIKKPERTSIVIISERDILLNPLTKDAEKLIQECYSEAVELIRSERRKLRESFGITRALESIVMPGRRIIEQSRDLAEANWSKAIVEEVFGPDIHFSVEKIIWAPFSLEKERVMRGSDETEDKAYTSLFELDKTFRGEMTRLMGMVTKRV
ncbi:MAG: hypothetical protein ACPL09_00845 [Candidatus Methanodesulfokora sp.]